MLFVLCNYGQAFKCILLLKQVMYEKYKEMVMVISDAIDKYYAESVRWPFNEGNPEDLLNVVKKVTLIVYQIYTLFRNLEIL